jgi:glycosyltransferase involved in cell wall biosynthesis
MAKLLIFTQKVDSQDSVLGFFCGWITAMAKNFESVHVICLEEGKHNLPKNVTVYSLGKEQGANKFEYFVHFWEHLYVIRGKYDRVFVHMNQEYVILGGLCWKLSGIPVYMWRNHPHGDFMTRIAVSLCSKVFCTSRESFTARFKKTTIMPVGIDTNVFKPVPDVVRKKNSICMVGRIAPIKGIEFSLEAVKLLIDSGTQISLSIIGSPLTKDEEYYLALKKYVTDNNLSSYVQFTDAVSPDKLPEIYSNHEICLNLTPAGSFDKTIVESASCGAIPLVSNNSLKGMLPNPCVTERNPETIAHSIQNVLNTSVRLETKQELLKFAKSQSLSELIDKLVEILNQ